MNVKIKATGVYCLIEDDYNRVYGALKDAFGAGEDMLFTERTPGHEYLQWELHGDGWTSLADGDPLTIQEVKNKYNFRRQNVINKFGSNATMAHKILAVPSDEYIYFKYDDAGHLLIRLTAWGYKYPERVDGGNATGDVDAKKGTEPVSIHIKFDGKPVEGKEFKINEYKRTTDSDGKLEIGNLPIGYQFDLDIDGTTRHITVTEGNGRIEIETATYANIEINATLDGVPYTDAKVSLSHAGKTIQLTCDSTGRAFTKVALNLLNKNCEATLDDTTQTKELTDNTVNIFFFALTTPEPIEEPEVPKGEIVDEPDEPVIEVEPKQLIATVEVKVTKDGNPYSGADVALEYQGHTNTLHCYEEG